ncbi:amidohydrolase family protein [Paraburkholderia tropica]|uniref:amidohydrolase family protein n=1 Tax=Paraburkholderia tropica TaxID=92647 RepID=UPI002AB62D3E|nr:amidohydrolase family protein [Paraburkholderia tropica]
MIVVNAPHLPVRPDWLALRNEPVLEPDLAIVDAHHHLWDRHGGRYLAHEFLEDIGSGHRIDATVFVQCRSMLRASGPAEMAPVGEVEFVNGVAAMAASGAYGKTLLCDAIVAGADLSRGTAVLSVIEAMVAASGGRLRGVRNPVAWHEDKAVQSSPVTPPRGLMADAGFRDGVQTLKRYGLSLDVWAYHTQLGEVYELAKSCPDTFVIVDHFGGPVGVGPYAGRQPEVLGHWRYAMAKLAELPNIYVKLGGAGMPVFGFTFAGDPVPPASEQLSVAWRPYFETCVELFGPSRCMVESNFPVDKGMFSYRSLWNAFKRLSASYSASERAALFSGTARRVYRMTEPVSAA